MKYRLNIQNFSDGEPETKPEDKNDSYAKLLAESLAKKDAEIAALKEKSDREIKDLTKMVLNGGKLEEGDGQVVLTDSEIQNLRVDLLCKHNANIQYMEKALALRKALMDKGEEDPFLPIGRKINPTQEDRDAAERAAKIYQQALDYARGDSEAFTNELQRLTRDISIRK